MNNKKKPEPVTYTPEELAAAGMTDDRFEPTGPPRGKPAEAEVLPPGTDQGNPQATPPGAAQGEKKPEAPRMTNFEYIEAELRRKENTGRMALALGYSGKDEAGKAEAFKYISSVLQEIKKTEGDDKKDLTICTVDSIVSAMIDAALFRLPIDGRGLAHLVKYLNKATLQIGYKGFLFKIAEHYKDTDFTAEPVFEGDEFVVSDNGGFQTYTHSKGDPFQRDAKKMKGLFACLAYSDDAGRHSKVAVLPAEEITLIQSKAKQQYIWKEWFFEKAKVAALKRLCKIHFATVMGVQEMMQYDNAHNFVLDTPTGDRIAPPNADDLQKKLSHQPAVAMETTIKPAADKEPVTINQPKEGEKAHAAN